MAEINARPDGKSRSNAANFESKLPHSDANINDLRRHKPHDKSGEVSQGEDSDDEPPAQVEGQSKTPNNNNGKNTHRIPRKQPHNVHKNSNKKVNECDYVDDYHHGHNGTNKNRSRINQILARDESKEDYEDLAQALLSDVLADTRFDYPQSKSIQQENGLLITVQKSRRYDINCVMWEAIHGLTERTLALGHLRRGAWKIPPHLDTYNPSSSNAVVAAPIGYNCFFYIGLLRILFKMIDDAPRTKDAMLVTSVGALKILDWYFTKLALGRDDRIVKRYLLESMGTTGDLLRVLDRLETLETNRTWLGKKGFEEYRDDIQPARLDFFNSEGAVAPTLNLGARRLRERQVCNILNVGCLQTNNVGLCCCYN